MIEDPYRREREGADGLVEGFYLIERPGRVAVPIHIWFGPPNDPDTGEQMDRSPRWQVEIDGIDASDPDAPALLYGWPLTDLSDIWPVCAKNMIDRVEYAYRVERAEWAEQYAADDPFGTKNKKIDPLTAELPFFSSED